MKEFFDQAYEEESKKFPAIFRMTTVNRNILIALLVIYVAGAFLLTFVFGEGDDATTLALIIAVVANMAILFFAYKCLTGGYNPVFQGVIMVVIPAWTAAIFIFPELRSYSSYFFILPLLWLEIMIIVEKVIHHRAQKRSIEIAEMQREHLQRETAKAFKSTGKYNFGSVITDSDSGHIADRDARYCRICGVELSPDNKSTTCPMRSKSSWSSN